MAKSAKLDETLLRLGREAVAKASKAEQEEALIHATEFIDTLPFKGSKLTDKQSLAWPRKGVVRDDGAAVTGVPDEIKEATSLVAGFILAKIPFDVPAVTFVMLKIGHLLKDDANLIDRHITWH
jgi:hypothetical protein